MDGERERIAEKGKLEKKKNRGETVKSRRDFRRV